MVTWCCDKITRIINTSEYPINYDPTLREFSLRLLDFFEGLNEQYIPSASSMYVLQLMEYCPFCGSSLPSSLRDEWFDTLRAMGFEDPLEQDIPEEYKSDAWWKEKGL